MHSFSEKFELSLSSAGNVRHKEQIPNFIKWIIGASTLFLFTCSSLRHTLFRSGHVWSSSLPYY